MSAKLNEFLTVAYRQQAMGEPLADRLTDLIDDCRADPILMMEAAAMLASIERLAAGINNLARRDFASYQHQRSLRRLLCR